MASVGKRVDLIYPTDLTMNEATFQNHIKTIVRRTSYKISLK